MGFSFGGLLAGAMKGIGEGYTAVAKGELENQQKLDYQTKILQLQEEKDRRIAEFQQDLNLRGKIREINEVDPLKTESEANRTRVVGAAETGVLTDRENALRPGKVQTELETNRARGTAERENQAAYASDPNARAGVRAKASDSESSSAKVTAESTAFDLKQKKDMAKVLEDIDAATDPVEKQRLEEKFKRLSGGKYASRYEAVRVKDVDGNEVTEILDKQTGYTMKPRSAGSAAGGGGAKPAEADAHAAAKAAIARGASKEAVNARLKENGYNPLP